MVRRGAGRVVTTDLMFAGYKLTRLGRIHTSRRVALVPLFGVQGFVSGLYESVSPYCVQEGRRYPVGVLFIEGLPGLYQ